jgi:hypothetical protein
MRMPMNNWSFAEQTKTFVSSTVIWSSQVRLRKLLEQQKAKIVLSNSL